MSRKRQIIEGIELPNQGSIRTIRDKKNFKFLGILEVDVVKQVERKEKKAIVPRTNEEATWKQTMQPKFHKRDEHLGCLPCKILGSIVKINRDRTQITGSHDNKIDDNA